MHDAKAIFAAMLFSIASFLIAASPTLAKSPYTSAPPREGLTAVEQAKCPPKHDSEDVPPIDQDRTNRDGSIDYFMGQYHWDDGKGNDLTLDQFCVHGKIEYFSVDLIQSKNGKYKTVARTGGTNGVVDTGAS